MNKKEKKWFIKYTRKENIMNNQKKRVILTGLFLFLIIFGIFPVDACDTWVALKSATKNGFTILAKNSDRTLFDCQPLLFHPRKTWKKGTEIYLGRITIPQVKETYATMGSSPYWCWGYEEGINEFGVAIGNEGIWTKVLVEDLKTYAEGKGPVPGPTGMDLLRLGLERGKTAREALDVIAGLVEKYGQFGSGIPTLELDGAYHNSYIIADPNEAWILETAGTHWIAKKISEGVASISNTLSIEDEWDLTSSILIENAIQQDWWDKDEIDSFDFTEAYSDDGMQRRAGRRRAQVRANRSCGLLEEKDGEIDIRWMMNIARDRRSSPSIDLDQTASSCVTVLPHTEETLPVFWWTPAPPSSGCFVPFFIHGSGIPEPVSKAGTVGRHIVPPSKVQQDAFSEDSYWWLFRDLTDLVNADWKRRNTIVRFEWDQLEKSFEKDLPGVIHEAVSLRKKGKIKKAAELLDAFTAQCVSKVMNKVKALRTQFRDETPQIPEEYKPFVGKYSATQNRIFTVKFQNDNLAVDIPGQMVFELNEPDDQGFRTFKITPLVSIGFNEKNGKVTAMVLNQTTQLPKKAEPDSILPDVPQDYHVYLGSYTLPVANKEFKVLYSEGNMALQIPDEGQPPLNPPNEEGIWFFVNSDRNGISFVLNEAGNVTALNLHQSFTFPRGEPAAWTIEKTIKTEGIEAAIRQYNELKMEDSQDLSFDENSFNALGYRLLNAGKMDEAIEIFKLNVEAYPESFNVYDSLGEAYMKKGNKELAVQNYKKSLELNPDNENGAQMLKQLQKEE